MNPRTASWLCGLILACGSTEGQVTRPDRVFADFEGETYAPWEATGTAFGNGPAAGTLAGQMHVGGFEGKRLINTFQGGDDARGTLTSPSFPIERRYVRFLIGGGGFADRTALQLLVDGRAVRSAVGPNTRPGGSEELSPQFWDVGDLAGRTARLRIVDDATGGWGHINVDQIVFTDSRPAVDQVDASREVVADRKYLDFPVKTGARKRQASIVVDGTVARRFEIEAAEAEPDWWASLDISTWKGKTLSVSFDRLREGSKALSGLKQGDDFAIGQGLYQEPLRPQFHFSARRGWLNDPNGLVFFDGEYHLFFQHNPYGWAWGNMHWGHAVGRDLIHWEEIGEALYPDNLGLMFSGSAVVDRENTSGLGSEGVPPLVLIYTAAGADVQCLASSVDRGRTWTKYPGNPVVPRISAGNRDPKVLWHAPTRRWVMVLYVGRASTAGGQTHTIQFLTSPNLRDWTPTSQVAGLFECPDLFELPLDGDAAKPKWVLTAASSEYMVGNFDGRTFTPETPKLPGHRGPGVTFYAAQTFSDIPKTDGRRLQIGWHQAASPGMPFNQAMSLPLELTLRSTPEGPRLAMQPARELAKLRQPSHTLTTGRLNPGNDALSGVSIDLAEIRIEFEPGDATEVALRVRGIAIDYDVRKQELRVNGHRAAAPILNGRVRLAVYLDRTTVEVFASEGLTYVPVAVIASPEDHSASLKTIGGAARLSRLDVHELNTIWPSGK